MTGRIESEGCVWEYLVFGSGKKTVFAFHGYGNNAGDFRIFSDRLPSYRIVAVNLLFHGNSWADQKTVEAGLSKEQLMKVFGLLMERFGCHRCALLGFSLGGRIVLKLIELMPERVEIFVLMASDGLRINPFYKMVTSTLAGKNLFRKIVKDPSGFMNIASALKTSGLLNEKKYHFAMRHFDTGAKRDKLYLVWMSFRRCIPDIRRIAEAIKKYGMKGMILSGKYDSIIPPLAANRLVSLTERRFLEHRIIESGHWLLNDLAAREAGDFLEAK